MRMKKKMSEIAACRRRGQWRRRNDEAAARRLVVVTGEKRGRMDLAKAEGLIEELQERKGEKKRFLVVD
ncbi:hypothetical protein Droror1_Dr00021752 [Drosera rotundifolia]